MAFNNYPAKRAIPFFDQVSQASSLLDNAVQGTRSFLDQNRPERVLNKKQSSPLSSFFNRVTEQVTKAMPEDITQIAQNMSQDVSQKVSEQWSQLKPDLEAEFKPSPDETQQLIADSYSIEHNLLIQFKMDDIDQTPTLNQTLNTHFADQITLKCLSGNHLTPLGQDVNWAAGRDFSPIDAVGQFMKQGAYQDLNQLRSTVLAWLSHHSN